MNILKQRLSKLLFLLDNLHHKLVHKCWWQIRRLAIYWKHNDCKCFKCKHFDGIYYDDYTLECTIYNTVTYDSYCMNSCQNIKG